jgi:hypothetical protein
MFEDENRAAALARLRRAHHACRARADNNDVPSVHHSFSRRPSPTLARGGQAAATPSAAERGGSSRPWVSDARGGLLSCGQAGLTRSRGPRSCSRFAPPRAPVSPSRESETRTSRCLSVRHWRGSSACSRPGSWSPRRRGRRCARKPRIRCDQNTHYAARASTISDSCASPCASRTQETISKRPSGCSTTALQLSTQSPQLM